MPPPLFQNAKFLVLDQDPEQTQKLTEVLRVWDVTNILSTTNPRETTELYLSFQPDLVLLDLATLEIDGFQAMRQLRNLIPETDYLPVVVLTSETGPDSRMRALACGAKEFLSKPIDPIELTTRLWNLVEARYFHIKIQEQYQSLEQKVEERTQELKSSREELRALVAGLSALREEDRTQMAREVHDVLGQALTGLKMDASWLDKRLAAGEIEPLAPLRERTGSLLANIDTTIKSVQRIASELRPPILDDFGLEAAVEWQVHVFQERTGLECDCLSSLGPVSIARERATAVFRILQEALTNVVRHSEAKRVGVLLEENKGYVVLEVRDNGRGFSPGLQKASKSLGLLGMRERALQVGGHLTIEGVPGGGTILTARIPLHSTPESLDGSERAANLTEVAA